MCTRSCHGRGYSHLRVNDLKDLNFQDFENELQEKYHLKMAAVALLSKTFFSRSLAPVVFVVW